MISLYRIWAVIYRHIVPTFRDPIRFTDMFYWPVVDITLFGFMAAWAKESTPQDIGFMLALLSCIACWYLVSRAALEFSRNFTVEMWDNHLVNIFATPLSLTEFSVALMILGVVQALITFFYCLGVIWLFFGYNILAYGMYFAPFMVCLIISGWAIGLLVSSILMIYGQTADNLNWSLLWLFALLSGVFYPLNLYPMFLQKCARILPMTYLFEGIRHIMIHKTMPVYEVSMGAVLSVIFFVVTFILFKWSFEKRKKIGLMG